MFASFTWLNRLRGTYPWFAKVNAAILGIIILAVYGNAYVAAGVMAGYVAGESMGWGEWIGGITRNDGETAVKRNGLKNGIYWLASRLFTVDTLPYHAFSLLLRGFWWWVPALSPLYFVAEPSHVTAAIIFLAVMFPVSVGIATQMNPDDSAWDEWEIAEYIYGGYQDMAILTLSLIHLLR